MFLGGGNGGREHGDDLFVRFNVDLGDCGDAIE